MAENVLVAGIDLGGTHFQAGVVRADGTIVGRSRGMTGAADGPNAVIDRLAEGVRDACVEAGVGVASLGAIGAGAPGAIDLKTGTVLVAPNLRWNHVPLGAELSGRLEGVPAIVDNDVTVAVWGEFTLGAAQDMNSALGVWIGTGVGGGVVIDGAIVHGDIGTAGEIGQTIIDPNDADRGVILESVCSRSAIERTIRAQRPDADLSSAALADAYRTGDGLVVQTIDDAMDALGLAIANHLTVLGVAGVVLGGGLSEQMGDEVCALVKASIRRRIFPRALGDLVEVRTTALRENAGLLGAAMLAHTVRC